MTKQRPNLAEVAAAAGSTRKTSLPESRPASGAEQGRAARPRANTRTADTKQIAAHFPAEVAWQLRGLAVERRTTVQALLRGGPQRPLPEARQAGDCSSRKIAP